MAELAERVYKRKRIMDPNNPENYVDIPVIYQARFKSMADQAQESWVYFDNSIESSRKVRLQRVTNTIDETQYADFERIEELHIKVLAEQAQEQTFILANNDPPPIQPNGANSPAHEKVHYVRYFKDNDADSECWVDVELIDELKIKCMAEQAQEYIWYLRHPELGDSIVDYDVPYLITLGYCDPALEMAN